MKSKFEVGRLTLEQFNKLPKLAQEMWFDWLFYKYTDDAIAFVDLHDEFNVDGCKSPIEMLFKFALNLLLFTESCKDTFFTGVEVKNQYLITANNKRYYADFVLSHSNADMEKSKMLVVECDGHEFHEKTKEQVANDNKRDYNIKSAGYDILHFSGSQIFNNPLACADDAINYLKSITVLDNGE